MRLEIAGEIQTRESQTVGEGTAETVSLGRAEVTRRRASLDTPRRARASHHPFPAVHASSPAMGKPDVVAVQDAAPRSAGDAAPEPRASSSSDLTSSLKRARATGLNPGSALSSSFDFLNEHRLGIKVVAPEDRPMTAGDVPPAGFASPAGAAGERESFSTPASSPVAAVAAPQPGSPERRTAARPATPPAPPFDSTPDDFGSPSNDPSRAATFTGARRVVGFSDADPTQFPHPSLVAYEQKTARGSAREDGRFARRARVRAAAGARPAPAGAALPLFLCAAVGTAAAKLYGHLDNVNHPAARVAVKAAVSLRRLGGRVVRVVRGVPAPVDVASVENTPAPVDVAPQNAPVDVAPAETLAELENAIVDDESIGESPHVMDESMDARNGHVTVTGANTHTPGTGHRTSHVEDNSQWLVKSPMDPRGMIHGEALLEGEVLPPPSPRESPSDAADVSIQNEVFEEATRIGRDLIRGLLPTPPNAALGKTAARWTPGPFDGVDSGNAAGGSPGTPPHDDEPPRETPPAPAPPPLAPEDARKLELAAAIFGESGLEVNLDALGRGKEVATAARVLTDSEFDDSSQEDSYYEPGEESESESDMSSDMSSDVSSDASDASEDDEASDRFNPSPATMAHPGTPPAMSYASGPSMGHPMHPMMMPMAPPMLAPMAGSVAGGSPGVPGGRSPAGSNATGGSPMNDTSSALQQQQQQQMAMMYQQFQQFQQYQAFSQMMQQQQAMMLGWAGQQQAQAAPQGTVFGGVRASFNGSVSEGGSFGTFGSGAPSASVDGGVAADEAANRRRVSKRAAAAHGKKAAMKRAFVALKATASAEKAARKAAAKAARREAKDAKRAARAARRAAEEAETRRLVKERALRELRAQLQQPAQAAALTA